MTLIVGTPHWNGICLNSDTRVTNSANGKYKDNAQKIAHIHGGIGMVASKDRLSAILLRETIRRRLDSFIATNQKFDSSSDLTVITELLIISAMKDTRNHDLHNHRPIYDTDSEGLIGITIPDQKLRLNNKECENLLSILTNGSQGLPVDKLFVNKYIHQFIDCTNGNIQFVEFSEFPCNTLYKYKLKLYDDKSYDIYKLQKVPFGQIEAMGSGSAFDYSSKRDRVLFFVLFSGKYNDVGGGALHLSMIHEFAEQLAPKHKVFNIKTFGGAIVPGVINTLPNGNGNTAIIECRLSSKSKKKATISKTYHIGNDLWVTTRSGDNIKLDPFPDTVDIQGGMFW